MEYDIQEMSPESPRHEILNALIEWQTKLRVKRPTRRPLKFSPSRDSNRKLDNMAHGQQSHFTRITFYDVHRIVWYAAE